MLFILSRRLVIGYFTSTCEVFITHTTIPWSFDDERGEDADPNVQAKKPKREKKPRKFTCACSASFPTKGQRNSHRCDCKVAKAQIVEEKLKDMTRPGSECDACGRLYSIDDILYRDKTMIIRLYEGTVICSDCAEEDYGYPHKEEPGLYAEEIEEYLQVRRSVAPFPWLKARREKLFKELTEELHKPERVQKSIQSGHDGNELLTNNE